MFVARGFSSGAGSAGVPRYGERWEDLGTWSTHLVDDLVDRFGEPEKAKNAIDRMVCGSALTEQNSALPKLELDPGPRSEAEL